MKKRLGTLLAAVLAFAMLFIAACSPSFPMEEDADPNGVPGDNSPGPGAPSVSGDAFTSFTENAFLNAEESADSYFAMDVSTASYSVLRRYIDSGYEISPNMVKTEEMINYFKYDYPAPIGGEPMSMTGNIYPCPYNSQNLLFSVGLRTKDIEFSSIKNNIVFLIDTSGSMNGADRLGLLQESFCLMADSLNDNDLVSVVTYAGSSKEVLNGVAGREKVMIKNAITDLTAGGSTGGAGGIENAYRIAQENFIEGGNNRVILATDGDFNVGISSQSALKTFISEKRQTGVYLSIMGFGLGNYKNTTMDTLAQNGNGAAYYIDSLLEAKKVMVEELSGTLVTVADDVKAMVSFNPDKVSRYRLLGYETKLMTQDEWNDSKADAGEIGAGHCVTAVYEITLSNKVDDVSTNIKLGNHWIGSSVRYKEPYADGETRPTVDNREVKEIRKTYGAAEQLSTEEFCANEDLSFLTAVAEFALILRKSSSKANADINNILTRLSALDTVIGEHADVYRADFLKTVKKFNKE